MLVKSVVSADCASSVRSDLPSFVRDNLPLERVRIIIRSQILPAANRTASLPKTLLLFY